MKQPFLPVALLLSATLCAFSSTAQKLHYTVSFPQLAHHEARITVALTGAKPGVLTFRMSRSSPGRYATHEFGKNVYDVTATDATGKALPLRRTEGDVYQVTSANGTATVSYTLFGNYADGTYAGIDPASIHLNMPAAFMWVKGYEKAPIEIEFQVPNENFTIATQLKPGTKKNTFTAPDLQYFMDSPTKIGNLHWRQWPISNGGKEQTMRLALEATASESGVDSLADIVKRIATQAAKVFGEYPAYDYGTYTFLASINPYVKGDGMEHRNSTMITVPINFTVSPNALGVFAHEFFHCWNVERIRPKTLEPFNFEKSNMSNELWCAEGFTQYYGQLLMVRAGLLTDTSFAGAASGFINSKANTPGGTLYTPIQASNMAVFTDAGRAIDATNFPNIFTSYYVYGASIALALDLTLRQQYNTTLDSYMEQLWKRHGKSGIPYTVEDMQTTLAALTNPGFASTFFKSYVYGTAVPDYKTLLAPAGLELRLSAPGKAWMGGRGTDGSNGVTFSNAPLRNTPLYEAGVDAGDVITALDEKPVRSNADLSGIVAAHRPGDRLTIRFLHRGVEQSGTLTLKEDPSLQVATYESMGKTVTPAMLQFRKAWLGTK